MRTAVSLGILVVAGTAGDLALARAMKRVGQVRLRPLSLLRGIGDGLRQVWMWIGLLLHAAAFVSFLALLSWATAEVLPAPAHVLLAPQRAYAGEGRY